MKSNFLGDLHAERRFIKRYEENVIQIGDLDLLGYDWWAWQFSTPEEWAEAYKETLEPLKNSARFNSPPIKTGKRFFIDGNHDYFPALDPDAREPYYIRPNLVYIPRGYVSGRTMFIGGGDSIDKDQRTPHLDWFPEESFNYKQESKILDYEGKIEVVISHDCPYSAATEALRPKNWRPFGFHSSKFLEEVWKKFKPSLWVFGHFHLSTEFVLSGFDFSTKFICCNIGEIKNFDIPLASDFYTQEWEKKYGRDK